ELPHIRRVIPSIRWISMRRCITAWVSIQIIWSTTTCSVRTRSAPAECSKPCCKAPWHPQIGDHPDLPSTISLTKSRAGTSTRKVGPARWQRWDPSGFYLSGDGGGLSSRRRWMSNKKIVNSRDSLLGDDEGAEDGQGAHAARERGLPPDIATS